MSKKPLIKTNHKSVQTSKNNTRFKLLLTALVVVVFILVGVILIGLGYFVAIKTNPKLINDRQRQTISSEGEIIADITQNASPSVVSIITQQKRVLNSYFGERSVLGQAAGTGVIINKDGYILTNKHVVPEGTSSVEIVTSDGTAYKDVEVLGRDPLNDIAILKVSNPKDFQPAVLGDSDKVRTGQKVIAIGNALGQFQNTVTSGIISGVGRPIEAGSEVDGTAETLTNLFQTDTAINSGNSGGPLLNYDGEVIGINTAVAEGAQNIGFAIPINETKGIISSVKSTGELQRPFLGVRFTMITPSMSKQLNLDSDKGALISTDPGSIVDDSPAQKAGLKPGDIITSINDTKLDIAHPLNSVVGRYAAGDTIKVKVLRNGKSSVISIKLAKAPES